jgi:hypothetical protein
MVDGRRARMVAVDGRTGRALGRAVAAAEIAELAAELDDAAGADIAA